MAVPIIYNMNLQQLTYDYFKKFGSRFIPLSNLYQIVSGIYTRSSKMFVLEAYQETIDASIGFSRHTGSRVTIEPDICLPMLPANVDISFASPETLKHEERGIIAFEVKSTSKPMDKLPEKFTEKHPSFVNYLQLCATLAEKDGSRIAYNILNKKQLESLTKPKHILLLTDKGCQSFYDKNARYAITTGLYSIYSVEHTTFPNMALSAILNSKLFDYLRTSYTKNNEGVRNVRYESIANFPIPVSCSDCELLDAIANVASCLYDMKRTMGEESIFDSNQSNILKCLKDIIDVLVYQLYLQDYLNECKLTLECNLKNTPLVNGTSGQIIYQWYMTSGNCIRQFLMLLDSRSPELLYPIHNAYIR